MDKSSPFKLGIFIDGYTLKKVNEYYRFHHPYRSRIDFVSLRNWAENEARRVFKLEGRRLELECHYYHPHRDPKMHGGLTPGMYSFTRELRFARFLVHYSETSDVCQHPNMGLMSDALTFASYKRIDALVLLSTQGQFAPLPDRLKSMGLPTLLLGWKFSYPKADRWIHWRTDSGLRDVSTYYVSMDKIADMNAPGDFANKGLFSLHGKGASAQ